MGIGKDKQLTNVQRVEKGIQMFREMFLPSSLWDHWNSWNFFNQTTSCFSSEVPRVHKHRITFRPNSSNQDSGSWLQNALRSVNHPNSVEFLRSEIRSHSPVKPYTKDY